MATEAITVRHAAMVSGLSVQRIGQLVRAGRLRKIEPKPYQHGMRVSTADLMHYLKTRKCTGRQSDFSKELRELMAKIPEKVPGRVQDVQPMKVVVTA